MPRCRPSIRACALLIGGGYALHEGRYRLAFGRHASEALGRSGHGYLHLVGPVLAVLLALLAGVALARLARGVPRGPRRVMPFALLWGVCAVAVALIFCVQELTEGVLAGGHPSGLSAVLGEDGWLFAPLAICVGGLVALGLRGADAAQDLVAEVIAGVGDRAQLRPSRPGSVRPADRSGPRGSVLALRIGGRAPPAVLLV